MFISSLPKHSWTKYLILLVTVLLMETAELKGAELSIIEPLDYQVVQRRSISNGEVIIRGALGNVPSDSALFETRFITDGVASDWTKLKVSRQGKQFSGTLELPAGGWYRFELRATLDGNSIGQSFVEHVGIGEVFVVAGQSNSANHGEVKQTTKSNRVATFDGQRWQLANDPQPGASGNGGSFLPPLGDDLVAKMKVPVGFLACGIGATSVREWLPKGTTFPNPPTIESRVEKLADGQWVSKGDAYATFVSRVKRFGARGFRAVLWHQGESDANQKDTTRTLLGSSYSEYLTKIIHDSRRDIGWDAPWFVAQVSYHVPGDESSPDIREAQASLWKDGLAIQGPDSDALKGELRERDGKGVHFSNKGLREHAARWAEKIIPWLDSQLLAPTNAISFNRDIRPFLSSTCFQCHGPDSKTREAGLRLDVAESATADLGGYVAIAAGRPDSSEAVQRIFSKDPEKSMPPPASGLKLTQEQKEIFHRWIEQGAVYEQHWAFHPVVRPQVPNTSNAKHSIDSFVQARLVEARLEPSKLACPETQIRRVTLDLTGLPPSVEELDKFLSDIGQRGLDAAYETIVERLLKSPRFGERMAWPWMLAAEFMESGWDVKGNVILNLEEATTRE